VSDFRIEFQGIRKTLNDELCEYNGKSQTVIHELAVKNKHYTYKRILEDATTSYLNLKQSKMWGPAVDNNDRGKAPELNLACMTAAEFNVLVQKAIKGQNTGLPGQPGKSSKDITCFFCKKKGHVKKDCKKFLASQNGHGGNNSGGKTWKTKPPKNNEPETKTVDGLEWHWCAKCTHWRTSHGTSEHGQRRFYYA
jgi:hypothetical protein